MIQQLTPSNFYPPYKAAETSGSPAAQLPFQVDPGFNNLQSSTWPSVPNQELTASLTKALNSMLRTVFKGVALLIEKLTPFSPARTEVQAQGVGLSTTQQADEVSQQDSLMNTIAGTASRVNNIIDQGAELVGAVKEPLGALWDIGSSLFGDLFKGVKSLASKGMSWISKIF